jgi:ABC-2 type transport system permease protein
VTRSTGSLGRIRRQAGWETRLILRNGEQLVLTVIIPVGLLLALTLTDLLPQSDGPNSLAESVATVLTVSVISAAFTSLAIATGFERRSGALRMLSTTPLSPGELLAGKALATVVVTLISSGVVVAVAIALGWRPAAGAAWAVLLILLGIAAWAPWALTLAGSLRAEAVLAVANGVFLVVILFGGVVIPASALQAPLADVTGYLPSGALAQSLTEALADGQLSVTSVVVLVAWGVAGTLAGARTFRWS